MLLRNAFNIKAGLKPAFEISFNLPLYFGNLLEDILHLRLLSQQDGIAIEMQSQRWPLHSGPDRQEWLHWFAAR